MAVAEFGPSSGDRNLVVHVDDIGMSRAANLGAMRALEGAATCGSIMVPCAAFAEFAKAARERVDLDLGVHLTLNAEFADYRWGPLRGDVPGLLAADRRLWRRVQDTVERATADEVKRELRSQVDRALDAGIDVTHLDSHMATLLDRKFLNVYVELGFDYVLPIPISREPPEAMVAAHDLEVSADEYAGIVQALEDAGNPVFDVFETDTMQYDPAAAVEHNRRRLERCGVGLSYLMIHPVEASSEIEKLAPDWRQRNEDCRLYSDGTMALEIESAGFKTLGMRGFRDRMRSRKG